MSVPFFYRMQNDNRHGNAPLERAGEREAGLSPGQEPVCAGHAAEGWPNCIAAPMTSFIVFSNNCSSRYLVLFNFHLFRCFIPFCSIKTYVQNLHRYSCCVLALCPALCDRLNNTHRHHGALYDYVFKRPTFLVFTSRSPELSPIDICSDTRKSTRFWDLAFLKSVLCRCTPVCRPWHPVECRYFCSQTFSNRKKTH